jgi:uncharacterized protein YqeY
MGSQILSTIKEHIKDAMKSKNREKLLTLRTLHSDIKNVGINKRKEVTDEDVASVISKGIKQRLEAIEQFEKAGRTDLVEKEQEQIAIYKLFQPKQLEPPEIEELVEKVITETGASAKKDMGTVMKALMPLIKGRADGKIVSKIVTSKLSAEEQQPEADNQE